MKSGILHNPSTLSSHFSGCEGRPSLFFKEVVIDGESVLSTLSTILVTGPHAQWKDSCKILILSWKSHEIYFSDLHGELECYYSSSIYFTSQCLL